MEALRRYLALCVLMVLVRDVVGVSINLCSSENTADGSANYNNFQTNGLCSNTCGSSYAYAITQGNNCWCSNYAPADTVSTSSCNEQCPGYPYEYCGSSSGLFGYVALGKTPAGTKGGSAAASSTTQQTSQARSSVPATIYVTSTQGVTETSLGSIFVTVTAAQSSWDAPFPSAVSSSTTDASTTTPASTVVVTATPDSTSTPTSTSSPTTEYVTKSPVTSIVTLPGQTQVSTIIITPSSAATADSSPLGQGVSSSSSAKGLSKGAVAGLAVGVALGISLIAGVIIFFLLRRMKKHREANEAPASPEMAIGGVGGTPSSVSRHTSTMSQNGLLNKNPRINTRGLSSNGWGGSQGNSAASASSPTGNTNRRSLGADQRLDPSHAIYTNEDLRHSDVSLQDNTDYSRKILSVRNRADGEVDDE